MKDRSDTKKIILAAGEHEFLDKGYKDASLRDIAAAAGVTTGAIYGYYRDKSALFTALVEPAAATFVEQFKTAQYTFMGLSQEEQIQTMHAYSSGALHRMLDYVYEHFTAFRLLTCCSVGTKYENYVDEMVELEAKATEHFMTVLRQNGYAPLKLSPNLIHILSNSYFSAIFEIVVHNMEQAEADEYVEHITAFFTAGWNLVLGIS